MQRLARIAQHVVASADDTGNSNPLVTVPTAASPIMELMRSKIAKLAKERSALKTELLKQSGDAKIQDVTVEMAINGARSIKAMVTETSDLDAKTGIAYRGMSLFDVNKKLPKAPGGEAALPEAAFWLLLTGEIPSEEETKAFTAELHSRSAIPANVVTTLNAVPIETHPMTQLSICMLALQK